MNDDNKNKKKIRRGIDKFYKIAYVRQVVNFVSYMIFYRIMRLVKEEEDALEETVKCNVKVVVIDMSSK